ncbi:unnamed protein product [Urochloa humidicola]
MAAVRLMSCRPSLLVLCSLYLFWMLSIHVPRAGSLSFNLSFSQPQSPDLPQLIAFSGDAYFSPDTIELTRNSRVNSVGRATYVQKVPLWDGATGELASFTTTFYFRISRDNPSASYAGDGMAFFLGHPEAGIPANSGGGSLGLVPVSHGGGIVAVEFDTFLNPENSDISYSHVGIDVNSVNSTASTDATTPTKNLTSGYKMMAAVSYENGTKLLNAELTINDTQFNVQATIDLRSYLPEYVVVGFSAATGKFTELHQVLAWSFSSTLEPTKTPTAVIAPAPPPLSPDIVVPSKKSKARVGSSILTPVLVPLLFLLACAAGLVLWQKHKRRRPGGDGISSDSDYGQGDETAELARGVAASGPKRYAYRELAAATNNFAEGEKLGRGGFGSVYRGKLVGEEERAVAIKILDAADERLRGGDDERCMERVLIVGLWCAHPDQSERPSMVQAMHVLQSEDARLPELPQQMYYRTSSSGFAITGRASGALSIEGYSGDSSATTTTTGDSKHSSGSSTTALLRDSKERA